MIATPEALREWSAQVRGEGVLALDTEFVWDRTYYARLGLVQIGLATGEVGLLDALALPDLSPVGEWLADERIVKILHDAPQDLMILRRATGAVARNVFDTRLAAGFAGLASTLSLANLLAELLGVHLDKAHTRADWTARPLAPAVLAYAEDDVRHLPEAASVLRQRARDAGVEAWMDAEMAALDDARPADEDDTRQAYQRIRAHTALPPRSLAVLRELAAWREETARATDRPRRWVVDEAILVALATECPERMDDLQRLPRLPPETIQRHGAELLAAIQHGRQVPEADWPPTPFQPRRDAAFRRALDEAMEIVQARAQARRLAPALVCSRNDLARLLQEGPAARPEHHALLRGWRAELLGNALHTLISI